MLSNGRPTIFFTSFNSASALPGKARKHENRICSLCVTAFSEFSQSLLDFFNFVKLQLIFTLL